MNAFRIEPSRRRAIGPLGLAALLLAGGCSLLPFQKKQTAAPNIAAPGQGSLTVTQLQSELLRFADDYASSVANAADGAAKSAGTREALVAGLKWKLDQATAVYVSATGENPVWDALDVVVLAVVSRMVVEDAKTKEEFGAAVAPLLETHRELEASAWTLVGQILGPEQRRQLEGLIVEWRTQNPRERSVGAIHFREFALSTEKEKGSPLGKLGTGSIFSLLRIDPFAGLDPATVAIEQSRELAARTVAYFERAPTLLRWQAELLALQLANQPDPRQLLADADRVSRSMESVSKTAEGLPALVKEEREAAIAQLLAGVAAEREAILRELDAREATIRGLLGETRQTLEAGTAMSTSLDATIKSLDAFVHYVSPPEPKTAPPGPPGKPFDVLDYGKSAAQVGGMARDLTALLGSVDKAVPALARASQEAGENLQRVVDRAFWRGLVLVLALLVGSVLAALAYRAIARRLFPRVEPGSQPSGA
jgi:hypothetical protein